MGIGCLCEIKSTDPLVITLLDDSLFIGQLLPSCLRDECISAG